MPLWQLLNLFGYIRNCVLKVRLVEVLEFSVEVEGSVEVLENAAVIDDVPEVLSFEQSVHAGDGLEQRVILELPRQVEHGIARGIKAGQQLIDDDDDFRLFAVFEAVDDVLVVLLFAAVLGHHPLPEDDHGWQVVLLDIVVPLAVIGTRNQNV